jgi:hypothetical protein
LHHAVGFAADSEPHGAFLPPSNPGNQHNQPTENFYCPWKKSLMLLKHLDINAAMGLALKPEGAARV